MIGALQGSAAVGMALGKLEEGMVTVGLAGAQTHRTVS